MESTIALKSNNFHGSHRIMVFRPTYEEFKDFSKYIAYMELQGAHRAGIAKVIPPPGWTPRRNGYDLDSINITLTSPVSQVVSGNQGVYQQINIEKPSLTARQFESLASSEGYCPPKCMNLSEMEKYYWENLTCTSPIYGFNVMGTLYDQEQDVWALNRLHTILDCLSEDYEAPISGVNTPCLYMEMWKTTTAWHIEDMDLYSVHYLHDGASKLWYAVPPEHGRRFERLANGFFPSSLQSCQAYLRHKMSIISPKVLVDYSIPCDKVIQEAGEFIVTFPSGYHSSFSFGFNFSERINFALPRWIEYGKRTVQCTCSNNMMKFNMATFVKRFQPSRYGLWLRGEDVGPHPEDVNATSAILPPINGVHCVEEGIPNESLPDLAPVNRDIGVEKPDFLPEFDPYKTVNMELPSDEYMLEYLKDVFEKATESMNFNHENSHEKKRKSFEGVLHSPSKNKKLEDCLQPDIESPTVERDASDNSTQEGRHATEDKEKELDEEDERQEHGDDIQKPSNDVAPDDKNKKSPDDCLIMCTPDLHINEDGADFDELSEEESDAHDDKSESIRKNKCFLCSNIFASPRGVRRHLMNVHGEKPMERRCFYCEESFTNARQLFEHVRSKHTRRFKCDICNKGFATITSLQTHQTIKHLSEAQKTDEEKETTLCKVCNHTFASIKSLRRHLVNVHRQKPSKRRCTYCDESFSNVREMFTHIRAIHKRPFKCDQCDKDFLTKSSLHVHTRRHTGEKPYSCEDCGKTFADKSNLRYHEKQIHSEIYYYLCGICPEQPCSPSKNHTCCICKKQLANGKNLQNHHKLVHSKPVRPSYEQCPHCDKVLTTSYGMFLHIRSIHEGKRPFKCNICQKEFVTGTDLRVHTRVHTGEKPYTCSSCGKTFSSNSNLRQHEKIHSDVYPFSCSKCSKKFKYKSALIGHEKTHEKNANHNMESYGYLQNVAHTENHAKLWNPHGHTWPEQRTMEQFVGGWPQDTRQILDWGH